MMPSHTIWIFFFCWSIFTTLNSARNVPNVDFPEDEVVLALSEDTTALQTYAIGFWKPLPLQKPYQEKFYHIQSGPGGESPLLERLALTMKNLVNKIIQKADFLQLPAEVRDDGLKEVFQAEDEILATFSPASNPTDSLQSNRDLMELHLRKVLSLPRNAKIFEDNRLKVGGFIFKALAKSGLLVGSYKFHFQRVSVNDQEIASEKQEGNNIVGLIPGKYYNTSQDRILIVGAHWDTFGLSPGFNDNGSGVAALLEVARVLATASCYKPDYSVFFVAFDAEESGCRGSQEFVSTHLGPHLKATGGTTQGAFILDTILNFDSRKNSQKFSKAWKQFGSTNMKATASRGNRGDFVATIARNDSKDLGLQAILSKHLFPASDVFHHEPVTLHSLQGDVVPSMRPIVDTSHFWMSDHSRFWYHLVGHEMVNLGAILITDTAYLRGDMEQCFHRRCDLPSVLEEPEKSFEFLSDITQAVINSVFELTSQTPLDECKIKMENEAEEEDILEDNEVMLDEQVLEDLNSVRTEPENHELTNETGFGSVAIPLEIKDNEISGDPDWIPTIKNFKPNFGGTQINIENFNVNNNFPQKQDQAEDLFVLMQKHSKVENILEKYFEPNKKKGKNSPMVIKFVNSDEL